MIQNLSSSYGRVSKLTNENKLQKRFGIISII